MTELTKTRAITDVFLGYNHNLRIGDGEFYDMKNLTADYYPVLSPRKVRGTFQGITNPLGLIAKDSLCYADGSSLYINGYKVEGLTLSSDTQKTLVSMGAYIIILPDKIYVNTTDTTEYGYIEASVTTSSNVTFSLCKLDGSSFASNIPIGSTAPAEPSDKAYWIDTSSSAHTLKQYSSATSMWVSVGTTYIKIASSGIGTGFAQYDGVKISGLKGNTQNADLDAIDGSFVIWEKGDNYIIIIGMLDQTATISNHITVKREMPAMDFVIESENRLWGCRYGIGTDGKPVNEIYSSKLGDFKNWNCFMGLSTDSYVASVGTDGAFTGAFTYLGHPLFFKEGYIHKIYGNYPSNYQIQTTACRGVQKGSSQSLAMVNETLFYKSKGGICAYDGSLPSEISSCLGEATYSNAVACSHGNKYYISMKDDKEGIYNLFVFDVAKRLWHKEDDTRADTFCSCRNELYYVDHYAKKIKTVFGSGTPDPEKTKWMAETGVICVDDPDKKYISAINVRMSLDLGSTVSFYIQYDSMGDWEHICTHTSKKLRSFSLPIKPRRFDHMRLRIEGSGDAKIYSITKTIEQGSDT